MWGGAVRERGGVSCPDHRGGAGSGISSTCAGRVRVIHDPVPIRPVAIPNDRLTIESPLNIIKKEKKKKKTFKITSLLTINEKKNYKTIGP